ncbi:MAG: DUF47 domain-containing protein [Motilibacteraceae bacterium]
MAFRLTPRDTAFYDQFAAAAAHLVTGAQLLREIVDAPRDTREDLRRRMRDAEHAADDTTHDTIRRLNSSFITPFDREDIYALAGRLDDVMDHMDAVADLVVLYQLDGLPQGVRHQIDVLCRAATLTVQAMPGLRSMKGLEEYWIEANRLENEADRVYRELLAELFSGKYDPLEVLKLKDVIEELEAAADAFEQVAHVVETVAVKES